MRGCVAIAIVASAGCSSILGIEDFQLADANAGRPFCLGESAWRVCLTSEPTEPLLLGNVTLDTDGGVACLAAQPDEWQAGTSQPDACFLVGSTITVSGQFVASGIRPLVLVAADRITVQPLGVLDVASHMTARGAGASPTVCPMSGTGTSAGGGQASAGGAGGSFGTLGGNGGMSSGVLPGGQAGATMTSPGTLRAGCNGGAGGSSGTNAGGGPGFGGGAVFALARNQIVIDGIVNASGAGGRPGGVFTGGGGGGAGGMIVLAAPQISGQGNLVANGGGGASGATGAVNSGVPGGDPAPGALTQPAQGGRGPTGTGTGGDGFAGAMAALEGGRGTSTAGAGGGGGGGGAGYIRVSDTLGSIVSSPAAVVIE